MFNTFFAEVLSLTFPDKNAEGDPICFCFSDHMYLKSATLFQEHGT
jgi:hypothetical protein